MDNETLLFLLKGGHMDMPTRIEKRLWPHPPLRIKQCVSVIMSALNNTSCFPSCWVERKNGELIDDFSCIEKTTDNKFIYHYREASPYNLKLISVNEQKKFNTAEEAIKYYLHHELHLPGDLDGWKVEE